MSVSRDTAVIVARELMKLSVSLGVAACDADKTIASSKGRAKEWLEQFQADRYRMSDEVKALCALIMETAE